MLASYLTPEFILIQLTARFNLIGFRAFSRLLIINRIRYLVIVQFDVYAGLRPNLGVNVITVL